jgi:hypothetical protein
MRFVTRAQWQARPRGSGSTTPFDPLGVCIHWEGAGWAWPWAHTTCDDKVRAIQNYHMDVRGWSDIAYNFLGCPHGYVFEGRGLNRRSAANGGTDQNTYWYAVQCLWGSRSGSPPGALLVAGRDAIDYCRNRGGAGIALRGHRDLKSTDCPGDQLYSWMKRGAPRPGQVQHILDLSEIRWAATHPDVQPGTEARIRHIRATLRVLGCGDDTRDDFRDMWRRWQLKLGLTGSDADGIPGEFSARRLASRAGYIYRP